MVRVLLLTPSKLSSEAWSGSQLSSPSADLFSHWYSMGSTPVASTVKLTESIQGMTSFALSGLKTIFGGSAVGMFYMSQKKRVNIVTHKTPKEYLTNSQYGRIGNNFANFVGNLTPISPHVILSHTWES